MMFRHQPGVGSLPCEPEDLLKVCRSMNMVKLSIDDFVSEPCETYVVTSKAPGAGGPAGLLQTHIVFYLESPAIRAVFSSDGNPYPAGKKIQVEGEAMEMVEQMGAILEDVGWEAMSPVARVQWLAQEYLFRLGEKRPRPDGRGAGRATKGAAAPEPPAPGPAVAAADAGEMESHFDALLDSAFFEPAERTGAAKAATPPPAAPPLAARVPSARSGPAAGSKTVAEVKVTGGSTAAGAGIREDVRNPRRTLYFLARF
jgi:hypothetical protein